jgi:hypothetical protein
MIVQRIKKSNGSPVAFILDKGNGVQCIQKLNGSVLGWYRPSPSGGRTTDPNGRVIGQGNVLASLVADLL